MVRLVRSASLFLLVLLTLGISCTIVEDSDITTPKQFDNLPLKSIEIRQETTKGNKSSFITPLYDSIQNFVDTNTGVKIVRRVAYAMTDLGNLKMKLRSGTPSATEVVITYKEGGQPYNFRIVKGDSSVEIYRFRYDISSRLNKIVTIINPIDNLPVLVHVSDSLIYTSSNISSIIRKSFTDPSKDATINIQYGGSGSFLSISNFTYLSNQYQQTQGNCPNNSNFESCVGYLTMPTQGGGGSNSSYTVATITKIDKILKLRLLDSKFNTGSNRDFDTYYFHPILLIRDQFAQGVFLSILYSIDWLIPGPQLNNSSVNQDESVSINFNYGI